jgi:hypothetical protein
MKKKIQTADAVKNVAVKLAYTADVKIVVVANN